MIGIVVVSHGKLAKELILAAEHVVGKQERIKAICIDPDDDMEVKRQEIIDAAKEVDSGKGIVILTDMFGGTPSNLAISIMSKVSVEVIAGANLPLLVKLASIRSSVGVQEAAIMAQEAGRKYINIASNMLNKS